MTETFRTEARPPVASGDVDRVAAFVADLVSAHVPELAGAVAETGTKASIAIRVDLGVDKESPERVRLEVVAKRTLPAVGDLWLGRIKVERGVAQLSLFASVRGGG